MNLKLFVLSIVVVFAGICITDFIIHGVLLKSTYAETADLWRSREEMMSFMGWMLLGQFVAAAVFVTLWAVGFAHRASIGTAVMYGVFVGMFFGANPLYIYAVQPVPGSLVFKWIVACVLQFTLMGLLVVAGSRPKSAVAGEPK